MGYIETCPDLASNMVKYAGEVQSSRNLQFSFFKVPPKKTPRTLPVSIPSQWRPTLCPTIMQSFSLETSRTTEIGWSEVCSQPVLEIGNFEFLKDLTALTHLGLRGKCKNSYTPSFRSVQTTVLRLRQAEADPDPDHVKKTSKIFLSPKKSKITSYLF